MTQITHSTFGGAYQETSVNDSGSDEEEGTASGYQFVILKSHLSDLTSDEAPVEDDDDDDEVTINLSGSSILPNFDQDIMIEDYFTVTIDNSLLNNN